MGLDSSDSGSRVAASPLPPMTTTRQQLLLPIQAKQLVNTAHSIYLALCSSPQSAFLSLSLSLELSKSTFQQHKGNFNTALWLAQARLTWKQVWSFFINTLRWYHPHHCNGSFSQRLPGQLGCPYSNPRKTQLWATTPHEASPPCVVVAPTDI